MKIAFFKSKITPEIGAFLAGYCFDDKSNSIADDLFMDGLCVDDGERKVLIISFDLLGLDEWYIKEVRKKCADILGTDEANVLFSCTHTHSGPESRTMACIPEQLNVAYLENLKEQILQEIKDLLTKDWIECTVSFYSMQCNENLNRRYVTVDNRASFMPHWKAMVPLCTQFRDDELSLLFFWKKNERGTTVPAYVIGNFAAHPLAGRTPGEGAFRISADFPGVFRDYVTSETGAGCMFITGAAGDMVPKNDEQGREAVREMGLNLGRAAIFGMIGAGRNTKRFEFKDPKVGGMIRSFEQPLRLAYRNNPKKLPAPYLGKDTVTLDIQCVSIGDFCIVGVPGELCAELGQEIKWHTPFKKAMIAYNSTAYFSYMGPANFLVSGGYEGLSQRFSARGGLALVQTAVDAMFDLREELYPTDPEAGEFYPDCNPMELIANER